MPHFGRGPVSLGGPSRSKYRPDIDGLRAIAVGAVLVCHLDSAILPGGFVGVDVFFVISGFLITGILRDEIAKGTFSLWAFYERRIRRIVPALVVVLIATVLAGYFFLLPGDYVDLGRSAISAALGTSNLYFLGNTSYFDRAAEALPLLHTWSLGVEEQFYLVWPLLLVAFVRIARRRWTPVPVLIGVVALLSLIVCIALSSERPQAAFYLPFSRGWELAVGAILTFAPAIRVRWASEAYGVVGLLLIAFSAIALSESDSYPGWNALLPVLGAALLIMPHGGTLSGRVLALKPLRHLGQISYSLYLWHWPVFVYFRIFSNEVPPSHLEAAGLALVSYALAVLSWHFVERPFRRVAARPLKVVLSGAGAITAAVTVAALVVTANGAPSRFDFDVAAVSSLDTMWEWDCSASVYIPHIDQEVCSFGAAWETAATKGIIWGDSHAGHFAPLLSAAIGNQDISFVLVSPCPAALNEQVGRDLPGSPNYSRDCSDQRQAIEAFLNGDSDITLVVLASAWWALSTVVKWTGGESAESPHPETGLGLIRTGIESLLNGTARPGRRFLLIGQVPSFPGDPVSCFLVEHSLVLRRRCDAPERQVWVQYQAQRSMDDILNDIANGRDDTAAVIPGEHLCSDGACVLTLNGELLYRDGGHIRRNLDPDVALHLAELIGLTGAVDNDR